MRIKNVKALATACDNQGIYTYPCRRTRVMRDTSRIQFYRFIRSTDFILKAIIDGVRYYTNGTYTLVYEASKRKGTVIGDGLI